MKIYKQISVIFFLMLLTLLAACSNESKINSDATKFMGEELGKPVSSNGELYYDEDKGCFLKTKNGAIADCDLKTKHVFKITINCEKFKSYASIDGVECGMVIPLEQQSNYQKLCNKSRFTDGFYLKNRNAYYWMNHQNYVESLMLLRDEANLRDEGEDEFNTINCQVLSKTNGNDQLLTEKEEKEYIKENCEKVTAWRTDAAELVAKAVNVPISSVFLIDTELGSTGRCLAVIDTAKGPTKCVVMRIFQSKETNQYAIDLGTPFAVQAVCGGLAF